MLESWSILLLAVAISPLVFALIAPLLSNRLFWLKPHFFLHRIGGFFWIFHYIVAWVVFLTDYARYRDSILPLSVPITGLWQVLTALYYFRFLPKRKADPGLYSDKGVLTFTFVQENLFFALIQCFGAIYHSKQGYNFIRTADSLVLSGAGPEQLLTADGAIKCALIAFEAIWVFLPFQVVRWMFPKTSFRDAQNNRESSTSKENQTFYTIALYVIKCFYLVAKHFMAGLLLYLRFLDLYSLNDQYWLQFMILCSCGTLYVAVFLHTLRFKRLIDPLHGYAIYLAYWCLTLVPLFQLKGHFIKYPIITAACFLALAINFSRQPKFQAAYQWALVAIFYSQRYHFIDYLV